MKIRKDLRVDVIDRLDKTFKWLLFVGWSNKNAEYDLVKFTDNTCGDIILWAYVYNEYVNLEFRKGIEVEHEFKGITKEYLPKVLEEIQYIY